MGLTSKYFLKHDDNCEECEVVQAAEVYMARIGSKRLGNSKICFINLGLKLPKTRCI
jgi:hypothetical protein